MTFSDFRGTHKHNPLLSRRFAIAMIFLLTGALAITLGLAWATEVNNAEDIEVALTQGDCIPRSICDLEQFCANYLYSRWFEESPSTCPTDYGYCACDNVPIPDDANVRTSSSAQTTTSNTSNSSSDSTGSTTSSGDNTTSSSGSTNGNSTSTSGTNSSDDQNNSNGSNTSGSTNTNSSGSSSGTSESAGTSSATGISGSTSTSGSTTASTSTAGSTSSSTFSTPPDEEVSGTIGGSDEQSNGGSSDADSTSGSGTTGSGSQLPSTGFVEDNLLLAGLSLLIAGTLFRVWVLKIRNQ